MVLFIVGLLYNKHTAPFNTVFHLSIKSNLKLHSDYPKLNDNKTDLLKFHLPANKIEEKEINNKSEVILNDLPYYLLGKVIKAELEDRFWKLSKDSIFFKKGTINLIVEPNETLSKVEGEVFTQIGGLPIENAIIHVEGLETKTNAFGVFTLTVPVEKRRIQYGLSIYKEGYKSYKKLYFSGEKAQIRLLNSPKKN